MCSLLHQQFPILRIFLLFETKKTKTKQNWIPNLRPYSSVITKSVCPFFVCENLSQMLFLFGLKAMPSRRKLLSWFLSIFGKPKTINFTFLHACSPRLAVSQGKNSRNCEIFVVIIFLRIPLKSAFHTFCTVYLVVITNCENSQFVRILVVITTEYTVQNVWKADFWEFSKVWLLWNVLYRNVPYKVDLELTLRIFFN